MLFSVHGHHKVLEVSIDVMLSSQVKHCHTCRGEGRVLLSDYLPIYTYWYRLTVCPWNISSHSQYPALYTSSEAAILKAGIEETIEERGRRAINAVASLVRALQSVQ